MVNEAGPGTDDPSARSDTSAAVPPTDFYDAEEWTRVLVGIGERFRSRVDGKVLQAMLSEMLAAHTELALAASADRVRHEAERARPIDGDRRGDKLSVVHSGVDDLEVSHASTRTAQESRVSEFAQALLVAAEKEKAGMLAAARAEAELIREQAVAMAESMIAAAADEADRRRRAHDEAIAQERIETEAEAVRVLGEALADADFIRSSAEEAGARTLAEAQASAEALRRAVEESVPAQAAAAAFVPATVEPETTAPDNVEPGDEAVRTRAESDGSVDEVTDDDRAPRSWRRGMHKRRRVDDVDADAQPDESSRPHPGGAGS